MPDPAGQPSAAPVPSSTALSLIALMKLRGIGRRTALDIVDAPLPKTCPQACQETLVSRLSTSDRQRHTAADIGEAWSRSEDELARGRELNVHAISFHDEAYPQRLRHTPDPPAVLFAKGAIETLNPSRAIAIVGTREPTSYGQEVARRSGRSAAAVGYVVVSGLALGCDTHAHLGCLDAPGPGVAVLAHGLDKIYPAANRDLAQRLLHAGGCLATEYPVGTTPVRSAFPERDRIQSGLSDAVLVIETDLKGGTMHTVRFARQQNRPLACIDHPPRLHVEAKTQGNRKLLEDRWATPVPNGNSLLAFLQGLGPANRPESDSPPTESDAVVEPGERQQSFSF